MSFDVSPLTRPLDAEPVDRPEDIPPIPAEVCDQVDAAARLAEDLQARGRSVRFDLDDLDGVLALLVDDDAGVLRALPLSDVVDVDRLAYELSKDEP